MTTITFKICTSVNAYILRCYINIKFREKENTQDYF